METIKVYKSINRYVASDLSELVCKYLYEKKGPSVMYVLKKRKYDGEWVYEEVGIFRSKNRAVKRALSELSRRCSKARVIDQLMKIGYYDDGVCKLYIEEREFN